MRKGFLILNGDSTAKNLLQDKLKENYWIWNVSTLNHLRHNATALGWDFTNDGIADEFIGKLLDLSNEYLDYEYEYVVKFMNKIMESNKAKENGKRGDLLIAHVGADLSNRLQDEFDFYVINVTMEECIENNFMNGRFYVGMGSSEEVVDNSIEQILNIICTNN